MAQEIHRAGFSEAREIAALGFDGDVQRKSLAEPDVFTALGKCRACGEEIGSEEKRRGIMPGTEWFVTLLVPFREHWEWHEVRRNASWDLCRSVLKRALASSALSQEDQTDLFIAMEKAYEANAMRERERCARVAEKLGGALTAKRLRNPQAGDLGIAVTITDRAGS